MIALEELGWSNIFSYGENNSIKLNEHPLTQIAGKNGYGKSAIAIIIQEALFGKNVKGIKKENLFNRNTKAKSISINLKFSDDEDKYEIDINRAKTLKLKLYKNGYDISSHTATGTYKQIEEIIGYDFKTFSQVTSQSSKTGLDFLTATDTARKNFLINFLNLEEYRDKHELFKKLLKDSNSILNGIEGSINTIEDWIKKHKEFDMDKKPILPVPEYPEDDAKALANLEIELEGAEKINKEISANEEYKRLLKQIPAEELTKTLDPPEDTTELTKSIGYYQSQSSLAFAVKGKYADLGDVCHTCGQDIDKDQIEKIISDANEEIHEANKKLSEINSTLDEIEAYKVLYNKHNKYVQDFEKLVSLIDTDMSNEYVDKEETKRQINNLRIVLKAARMEQDRVNKENLMAEAHNSKTEIIGEQLEEYGTSLKHHEDDYEEVARQVNNREILKDAFSTKGIVAYKIESLIKNLEKLINIYLSDLSDGRFLIDFILNGDKLNINIITDAQEVAIESLSEGELSRVNVATLLALRKMMNAISTNKINILFLDEITAVLDDEGKERLVEILFKEEDLNTFLIAHDYSHPLIPIITVSKTNNISEVHT